MVHVADVQSDPDFADSELARQRSIAGAHTVLGVPLLREGIPIGVIILSRFLVRPFTDKQIELVTTFADQAVIAIENVRLFEEVQARTRELSDALEQQTATSEVLRVISSSPGELGTVFQTMLVNATKVCEATFGNLTLWEGDGFRAVAVHGETAFTERRKQQPKINIVGYPTLPLARLAASKSVVHVADFRTEQVYLERHPPTVELVEVGGARTLLCVPMLKEDNLIGAIVLYRQEVRPFTNKQIELVKKLRRSGRHRDRERAPAQRAARIAAAADRDRRGATRHLQFAGGPRAGVPGLAGKRSANLPGEIRCDVSRQRRDLSSDRGARRPGCLG
jgi:GAF domain-containing protein